MVVPSILTYLNFHTVTWQLLRPEKDIVDSVGGGVGSV